MNRFLSYELEHRVGSGGSAEVWQARTRDGRLVAVKLFNNDVSTGVERLRAGEPERLARIDHPRILRYLDAGHLPHDVGTFATGTEFIVTEFVAGPTLAAVRPPDWSWVQTVTLQLLDALASAHARNIVHLDVKPTNVLLRGEDPPDVLLADFGIAHHFQYESEPGAERPVVGTPGYMAPEQIRCYLAAFGPWTDVYSVGSLVYELCTGQPLFPGSQVDVLKAHAGEPRPPLGKTRFAVPDDLGQWLGRCLVIDTTERFARAADAAWALALVCRDFATVSDAPVALEPDALVIPDSCTITWVGGDFETIGAPSPSPDDQGLTTFPMAPLPATWWRGQDLKGGPFADFNSNLAVLDALWSEIHTAFHENAARGVVLHGSHAATRASLLRTLLTRVFEFGVGTHVLLREDDSRALTDRVVIQLFRTDHFREAGAAALHCEKVLDALSRYRPLQPPDALALRDWIVELVDGEVSIDAAERLRLVVELLRAFPRTPLVLIEGLGEARLALARALLDASPAGTGLVVIVSADHEVVELDELPTVTSLSLDSAATPRS